MSDNPQTGAQSTPAPEATTAPQAAPKLIFGKYKDEAEAEKGYFEMVNHNARNEQRLQQLEQERQQAASLFGGRDNPAFNHAQRQSPLAQLEQEFALPQNIMQAAIREQIAEVLQPVVRGYEARADVVSRFPDFVQKEGAVMSWLKSSAAGQTYANIAQADPKAALEWAITMYDADNAKRVSASGAAEQAAAREQAGLPGSQAPGSRTPTPDDVQERAKQALAYLNQYGDPRPYLHEALKGHIPEGHIPTGW